MTQMLMPAALKTAFAGIRQDVDACFESVLRNDDPVRAPLFDAMRYAAIGGGKGVRPLLVTEVAALYGVDRRLSVLAGTALEAVHVYSLIHDDLPAMDDDDMRRGKPTVHKKFGEDIAILAGDSFMALAFEMLSSDRSHVDPHVRVELVSHLAIASGGNGMAGGQVMDLAAAHQEFDLDLITRMQQLKTGALISAAVEMGAILGRAPHEQRLSLRGYARNIGLAFQIADDLLDATGDEEKTGKALHKDADAGKATFLSLMGLERAREQAQILVDQAIDHLSEYDEKADILRDLARYIIARDR